MGMSTFESTSKRLQSLKARIPEFPLEKMRLVRMTYHLQKNLRDLTNAALKQHNLADAT
jgi:MarR family transcriptional repressor of emrRAB